MQTSSSGSMVAAQPGISRTGVCTPHTGLRQRLGALPVASVSCYGRPFGGRRTNLPRSRPGTMDREPPGASVFFNRRLGPTAPLGGRGRYVGIRTTFVAETR
ncbi:hypothetical protein ARTHRO9AX_10186 [Arthrobacter sp. 9AX]|nr:hypothetical protein ARTHRO9AX_10186 [Arthrobacter sp. 9AX]